MSSSNRSQSGSNPPSSREELDEAWALVKAMPAYYHDPEEGPAHFISMNDVWGWACSDAIVVTDDNVQVVAQLYHRYGFAGLLFYCVDRCGYVRSEFVDNNRMIQFVQNEERIRAELPDSNKRAYTERSYFIDGLVPDAK